MSKEILKALIQLFAIFAKQDDGVSKGERDTVYSFLKNTLQISSAQYYIDEFDRFAGISKSTHEKTKILSQ